MTNLNQKNGGVLTRPSTMLGIR